MDRKKFIIIVTLAVLPVIILTIILLLFRDDLLERSKFVGQKSDKGQAGYEMDQGYAKAEKLVRQAIREGNIGACGELRDQLKDECIFTIATGYFQDNLCEKIVGQSLREKCMEYFIYRSAIQEAKIESCGKIKDEEYRYECQTKIFNTYKSADQCSKVNGPEKILCDDIVNRYISYEKGEVSGCEFIQDNFIKNDCIFAVNTKPDDADKDGLIDSLELSMGLDSLNPDTDGDGIKDYDEVMQGTNPRVKDKKK